MAVNQLIVNECANWLPDHKCIGVSMFDNIPFGNGRCIVILNKKKCKYFEKCVLPLAKYSDNERDIVDDYCIANPSFLKKKKLRMCRCGKKSLDRGKQLCDKCRVKGRKKTWKKTKRKQRG